MNQGSIGIVIIVEVLVYYCDGCCYWRFGCDGGFGCCDGWLWQWFCYFVFVLVEFVGVDDFVYDVVDYQYCYECGVGQDQWCLYLGEGGDDVYQCVYDLYFYCVFGEFFGFLDDCDCCDDCVDCGECCFCVIDWYQYCGQFVGYFYCCYDDFLLVEYLLF